MSEAEKQFDWENSTKEEREKFYREQKVACLGNEDNTNDRCGYLKTIYNEWGLQGCSFLDMPCHDGYVTRSFLRDDCHITGLDISEDAIEKAIQVAQERYPDKDWNYQCVNFEQFDWRKDSFDYVVCFEFIEHIVYEEVGKIIRLMNYAAKKGVFISTPQVDGVYGKGDHNKSHINLYDPLSLTEQIIDETNIEPVVQFDKDFIYAYWLKK